MILKTLLFLCILSVCCSKAAARPVHPNKGFRTYGDVMQYVVPVSAGVYSLIRHDYEGAIHVAEGAIYTQILTEVLKYSVHEYRPDRGNAHSFPSGHTMSAMNGAAYMQFRYGWKLGVPFYLLGASVGASRIASRRHNWWDTVASAALATGVQYLINRKGMSVAPYIMGKGGGVSVSATF